MLSSDIPHLSITPLRALLAESGLLFPVRMLLKPYSSPSQTRTACEETEPTSMPQVRILAALQSLVSSTQVVFAPRQYSFFSGAVCITALMVGLFPSALMGFRGQQGTAQGGDVFRILR